MDTTFDHLVTNDSSSDLRVTDGISHSSCQETTRSHTSTDESILDLSQRSTTVENRKPIDNWKDDSTDIHTDSVHEEFNRMSLRNDDRSLNIAQSLTDQMKLSSFEEHSVLSDNSKQSQMDLYYSKKTSNSSSSQCIVIHELQSRVKSCSANFLWSTYLSRIGERSVSGQFFDHYLASVQSGFEIDMKLEYCYDVQRDLYWLTRIQLVSHSLIRLHYVGLPDDDKSNDFWAYVYEQRCHPIGWCRENSKLMLPPPVVTKRATLGNNSIILNGNEKQSIGIKGENEDVNQTPPAYLFNKDIGLTPAEQLKHGMLLELQDLHRPWTLWFVRIITNQGGRLHLRYVTENDCREDSSCDIYLFYLDRRVHPIGWTSNHPSVYSYDIPTCSTSTIDKQRVIDMCLTQSNEQFLPRTLFKDQQEVIKHRFTEGMKLEVFDVKSQHVYIGRIGSIHNEYYFDVMIDNEHEQEVSFVSYSSDPHLLPPHWAAEHKLALMNGKGLRQSEDYWNLYTEKYGLGDLAPERCFNLLTLNAAGNNRVEPGMKMEMIYTLNGNEDRVFSMTLIHVIDHLMWLRVDDTNLFDDDEHRFYHVLPINSLDVFPVGWAKFNGFQLITPIQYEMEIKTYEQNRYDLFSSVTHYPQIPRVYLNEVYLLTIYINIRCFCGPYICASRLARLPSQFGPGPYRHVLIDLFHHLLSILSTHAQRALRRLDHQINPETSFNLTTEHIKSAKRSSKLIRPISIPNEPRSVHQYLRHICTQLEACPNLLSIKHIDHHCPDKCHILSNTFTFFTHSKHKRTHLRAAQNRYRKQKSLLCHLKSTTLSANIPSPIVEELPFIDIQPKLENTNDLLPTFSLPLPGSDRQTRGLRVHIEPKTHTITRTNKKQKLMNISELLPITIKQEPIEFSQILSETSSSSSSTTTHAPTVKVSKRLRIPKKKRSLSPTILSPSVTVNLISSNKTKEKRRFLPKSQTLNIPIPKSENQSFSSPSSIRSTPYSMSPPMDPRNPVTWNVNDVCWYLDECGCSFALKIIQEQEIDGAALLLLDDLDTVQDLLEFKLGPAIKFCHVVEQLRTQVIETFHSSPSLKTSSRLSTS